MHLAPLIRDLAVILGVAGIVTLIFQRIRQPVVLGYIVAGLIVGPYTPPVPLVTDLPNIKTWAELGVIFLMFSLGLDFSFRKLSRVGISAAITACFEVSLMMVLGYLTGRALGWKEMDCIFLGAMLSISSTTIIIKALDELKLRTRRFTEIIFGVLVVEDLVAVLILVALSTLAVTASFSGLAVILSAAKLLLVIGSWFLAGYFLVPRFVRYVGKLGNEEMLTIVSMGLCLSLAVLAASLHYSVALGAFIMGSILAESTESYRIHELMGPLRDLFAAIFFVSVGMLIDPRILISHAGPIALITAVLIVGKIVNITLGSLLTGQTLRTSVQVGFGMAQIGEFSFIIATLGLTLGVTSGFLYPVAVAVSILSTFATPYLIRVSHKFAVALERRLPLKAKHVLSRYSAWTLERKADSARRGDFYKRALRWMLNAILVTVAFTVVAELGMPWLDQKISVRGLSHALSWVSAALISAPFIWGKFWAFHGFRFDATVGADERGIRRAGSLFLSRVFTILWIGVLSLEYFPGWAVASITATLMGGLFFAFHKQLASSYKWFEDRFLSTFENQAKTKKPTDVFRHLAPWDAHLVRFKVHPNSSLAGRKLSDTELRTRFGLSVVAIQRGLKSIVAPHSGEQLFPKDELLVLGTDEQVEAARGEIEKPPGLADRFKHISGYELRHLIVSNTSPLCDVAIRDSGIRERCGGMVVGLERGDERIINPNSNLILKNGDVLWVVGETDRLQKLK